MIGWECPKCGKTYSPFVQQCLVCAIPEIISSSTTTAPPEVPEISYPEPNECDAIDEFRASQAPEADGELTFGSWWERMKVGIPFLTKDSEENFRVAALFGWTGHRINVPAAPEAEWHGPLYTCEVCGGSHPVYGPKECPALADWRGMCDEMAEALIMLAILPLANRDCEFGNNYPRNQSIMNARAALASMNIIARFSRGGGRCKKSATILP